MFARLFVLQKPATLTEFLNMSVSAQMRLYE